MKIIHCADLHLGAALTAHFPEETARLRRDELLSGLGRIVGLAEREGAAAILIAGDLYDSADPPAALRRAVLSLIGAHPRITFFYLQGNHDDTGTKSTGTYAPAAPSETPGADTPPNLVRFTGGWSSYALLPAAAGGRRVVVTGTEGRADGLPSLDPKDFNIVLLHGQTSESRGGTDPLLIPLPALRGRGIDYLALGHLHAYRTFPLDARGTACYSGTPEGRGFDETGPHGFSLLEITFSDAYPDAPPVFAHRFVASALRTVYDLRADVTGCADLARIGVRAEEAVRDAGCTERDIVRIRLTGTPAAAGLAGAHYVRTLLSGRFFHLETEDMTTAGPRDPDVGRFRNDTSLKGEFVRLVLADTSLSPDEKTRVIRCGLEALGEDT